MPRVNFAPAIWSCELTVRRIQSLSLAAKPANTLIARRKVTFLDMDHRCFWLKDQSPCLWIADVCGWMRWPMMLGISFGYVVCGGLSTAWHALNTHFHLRNVWFGRYFDRLIFNGPPGPLAHWIDGPGVCQSWNGLLTPYGWLLQEPVVIWDSLGLDACSKPW